MKSHTLTSFLDTVVNAHIFRGAKYAQGFTKFVTCNAGCV